MNVEPLKSLEECLILADAYADAKSPADSERLLLVKALMPTFEKADRAASGIPCYVCLKVNGKLSFRSRCVDCEAARCVANERENERLRSMCENNGVFVNES